MGSSLAERIHQPHSPSPRAIVYMQMGGAAGKGMQGGQNMQGMNMQDQMTPQL